MNFFNIESFGITRLTFILAAFFTVLAGIDPEKHKVLADTWKNAPQKMTIEAGPKLPNVNSVIKRDPFSGAPVDKDSPALQNGMPNGVPNPGQIQINPQIVPQIGPQAPVFGQRQIDVPNVGSIVPMGDNQTSEISVIATIIGTNKPMALVSNGKDTEVVQVGNYLGSHKIRRIVAQGIEFDDGTRLSVVHQTKSQTYSQNNQQILNPQQNNTSTQYNNQNINSNTTNNQQQIQTQTQQQNLINNVPTANPVQYNFGPPPTPAPGTTPATINRLYTPTPLFTPIPQKTP